MNGAALTMGVAHPLPGCDPAGDVYLRAARVLRGIHPKHTPIVRDMLERCRLHDLFRAGIVETREVATDAISGGDYALVLEHERVPLISYPHEWPASGLKEAALFVLRLSRVLVQAGIVLKDWHPYNVLFRGTTPVFVDFTSLLPRETLRLEPYLRPASPPLPGRLFWSEEAVWLHEVFARTFAPFCLRPLRMMAAGRHSEARRRLSETALNTTRSTIAETEMVGGGPRAKLRDLARAARLQLTLTGRGDRVDPFLARLEAQVTALAVHPRPSGYGTFYADKGEDLPFDRPASWPAKPRIVGEALERLRPTSVLDLGANTGWYSILAARRGCRVTALDRDEYCSDALWIRARQERLDILPLVLDVCDLPPERFPLDWERPGTAEDRGRGPLLFGALERLRAEAVLALGIVHHLALGRGWGLDRVAATLAGLTGRGLLVEFVELQDSLIAAEPAFFPAWNSQPEDFRGYSLERFLAELRRHFAKLETWRGHPETRTLILCLR